MTLQPEWPVLPMELVTRTDAYDDANTIFQVKWDGVRCLSYVDENGVRLYNRRLHARSAQYPELLEALALLPAGTVLDGEIIAPGPDGKPLLPRILRRDLVRKANQLLLSAVPIQYMIFDVLWLRGQPMHSLPLTQRLDALTGISLSAPVVRVDSLTGQGNALFAAVQAEGLEGIVAKKAGSLYRFGQRSPEWEKIKCMREEDGFIGGFIPKPDGMRCVLVGMREAGGLLYAGKASSGPTQKQWKALREQLEQLRGSCPFLKEPDEKEAVWVRPELPIRVRFMEYTQEGVMRAPAILSLGIHL